MRADWAPAQASFDMHGRRILDRAEGILIGLRRCTSEAAFTELLGAAQRHRIPVFTLAWALVHLASGADKPADTFRSAQTAARHEWGGLLRASYA
ncbi:MAG TPA: ANTAR domain-containing protein [Mycobacterium sp.]|nr:ANTAR domain-containing protein [Mycobacterium sp.]